MKKEDGKESREGIRYFPIRNDFVTDGMMAGLSGSAVKVLLCLCAHRNNKTGTCFPSYRVIKMETGLCHNETILRAVETLRTHGLVEVVCKGVSRQKSNLYETKIGICSAPFYCEAASLPDPFPTHAEIAPVPVQKSHRSLVRKLNPNNKNINKTNKTIPIPPERIFEEDFWPNYPKRRGKRLGKTESMSFFLKHIRPDEIPMLIKAVKHYGDSEQVHRNMVRDPIRFLKNDYWRDWTEPETKRGVNYGKTEKNGRYSKDGNAPSKGNRWGQQPESVLPDYL